MTQPGESYLIWLGPPAHGDTIHVNTCRYAQRPNALRWNWADQHNWDPTRTPWLKCCKVCKPEEWMARRILEGRDPCVMERVPGGSWLVGDRWRVWRGVEIIASGATRRATERRARQFLTIEKTLGHSRISLNGEADRIPLNDLRGR